MNKATPTQPEHQPTCETTTRTDERKRSVEFKTVETKASQKIGNYPEPKPLFRPSGVNPGINIQTT